MDTAWQNFWLDFVLVIAWGSQGFLFTGNWANWRVSAIGVLYWIGALSVIGIMAGDFALALGYTKDDYWFLERQYRIVQWRYGLVGSQILIALMCRFAWLRNGTDAK